MKVSKNVSVDLELLNRVVSYEKKFSKAVSEALELWLMKKDVEKSNKGEENALENT